MTIDVGYIMDLAGFRSIINGRYDPVEYRSTL